MKIVFARPSNVRRERDFGSAELIARGNRLDLNDDHILGGRQHDWTIGGNWYLTSHFTFQANYVKADASRRGVRTQPEIFELRAQVHF